MSEALLDHATETIRVGSKSFAAAAKLFDRDTRRSVLMLYAWCRHCDDVVDGQEFGHNTTAPGDAAAQVERLRNQTLSAYAGEPQSAPAFAAFQDVALRHAISPHHAFDHLAGFAMDAADARYDTIDDTLRYCYHVAGVVGLMMASIMGARDAAVLDRACDLGLAFQLANIARDLDEDDKADRCYLPLEWLAEEDIEPGQHMKPHHRQELADLAARLIRRMERHEAWARMGAARLPFRSRWAVLSALRIYGAIGRRVVELGPKAWDHRVVIGPLDKLRHVAGAFAEAVGNKPEEPAEPAQWNRSDILIDVRMAGPIAPPPMEPLED